MLSELRRVEERLQPFIQRAHTILETATTAEYNNNTVGFKQKTIYWKSLLYMLISALYNRCFDTYKSLFRRITRDALVDQAGVLNVRHWGNGSLQLSLMLTGLQLNEKL